MWYGCFSGWIKDTIHVSGYKYQKSVFWTFLWKLNPCRGQQWTFKVQCTSTIHRALNNQHKVTLSPRWQKSTINENVEASSQSCYNVLYQIWCVGARKVLIRAFCLFPLHSSVSQPIQLNHTWSVFGCDNTISARYCNTQHYKKFN